MKERYYYERDRENKPMITNCLLKHGKEIARGVSICSYQDVVCKKVGRKIAFTRAIYALTHATSTCKVKDSAIYKAVYNPKLTEFETRLLADYTGGK